MLAMLLLQLLMMLTLLLHFSTAVAVVVLLNCISISLNNKALRLLLLLLLLFRAKAILFKNSRGLRCLLPLVIWFAHQMFLLDLLSNWLNLMLLRGGLSHLLIYCLDDLLLMSLLFQRRFSLIIELLWR